MKPRKGVSLEPQEVNSYIWYYENPGSIHIYMDRKLIEHHYHSQDSVNFKITKHKLMKWLKRMNYKRRVANGDSAK